MKWYNWLILVGILMGLAYFLGRYESAHQETIRTFESQKVESFTGAVKKMEILKNYPVPIEAQKQIEKINKEYLQYWQEVGELERMKKKELERINKKETKEAFVGKVELKSIIDKQWKTVAMNVSAYCPCVICCENFADGITASGHRIKPNDVFVAAPRKYPSGTEMIIEGYAGGKIVKVEDVGGAIKGNKLDLFFHTHAAALQFGRQQLDVLVKIK